MQKENKACLSLKAILRGATQKLIIESIIAQLEVKPLKINS